jgi:hypothetical protein
MRGGNHSKDIREYVITNKGVVIIHPRRTDYIGLTTGIPQQTGLCKAQEDEAAPEPKATKQRAIWGPNQPQAHSFRDKSPAGLSGL